MSYKKAFKEGYLQGIKKGISLSKLELDKGIEFAGAIRKKQSQIIHDEIKKQASVLGIPDPICGFSMAWVGACKSTDIHENGQCKKHQDTCSCGNLAVRSCAHAGQFVCGRPLCDTCKCNH